MKLKIKLEVLSSSFKLRFEVEAQNQSYAETDRSCKYSWACFLWFTEFLFFTHMFILSLPSLSLFLRFSTNIGVYHLSLTSHHNFIFFFAYTSYQNVCFFMSFTCWLFLMFTGLLFFAYMSLLSLPYFRSFCVFSTDIMVYYLSLTSHHSFISVFCLFFIYECVFVVFSILH